jgi:hypothetical protein
MRGIGRRGCNFVGVTVVELRGNISRHLVVQLRCARSRGFARAGDCRQCLDIEQHSFGGVLRLRGGLGDDNRDRITDIAHRSLVNTGRAGRCIGVPSRAGIAMPNGIGFMPAAVKSGPV